MEAETLTWTTSTCLLSDIIFNIKADIDRFFKQVSDVPEFQDGGFNKCLGRKIPLNQRDKDRGGKDGIKDLIMKTCLYNFDPLKPHFYIVKLGFTGVYTVFLIFAEKHRLWVLVRTTSPRQF